MVVVFMFSLNLPCFIISNPSIIMLAILTSRLSSGIVWVFGGQQINLYFRSGISKEGYKIMFVVLCWVLAGTFIIGAFIKEVSEVSIILLVSAAVFIVLGIWIKSWEDINY